MDKLIKKYNTKHFHIEIDTINQFENMKWETNKSFFTYTFLLVSNKTNKTLESVSIVKCDESDFEFVDKVFTRALHVGYTEGVC